MVRKRSLIIAMLVLTMCTSSISASASSTGSLSLKSNVVAFTGDDFLSIRQEPTSNSLEIGRLEKYAGAEKTGKVEGDWIEVTSGGITGWVYKPYISSGKQLSKHILKNLKKYNVRVMTKKVTGKYLDVDSLKKDNFTYTTKVTIPKQGVKIYKTASKSEKMKHKYKYKEYIQVSQDGVHIRNKANMNSRILELADKGREFTVKSKNKHWYAIKYEGGTAYIKKDLCIAKKKKIKLSNVAKVKYKLNTMYDAERINKNMVKVVIDDKSYYADIDDTYFFCRANASSSAISVANKDSDYRLKSIDKKNKVYEIKETNSLSGSTVNLFMKADKARLEVKFKKATRVDVSDDDESINNASDAHKGVNFIPKSTRDKYVSKYKYIYANKSTPERNKIVNFALKFLGNPYVYGGTDINNGIDCSAFVQYVLQHFGKSIGRCTSVQVVESSGKTINIKDIQPGDLIYYTDNGVTPYHVVMYLGGDKCVNASCRKWGICISTIQKDKILKVKNYID